MDPNQRNVSFIILLLAAFLIVLALLTSPLPDILAGWCAILISPSVLITDYVAIGGLAAASFNAGIMVLLCWLVLYALRAELKGMLLAGIFTVAGFSFFGKNLRNILPIMIGVYFITIFKIWSHTDPGPLIAALFSTALAPVAGKFGFWAGVFAGILHLPMVMHVGNLHGFMNLYSNGFAGGVAVMVLIGILKGIKPEIFEEP